ASIGVDIAQGVDCDKYGGGMTDFVRFNAPKPKPADGNTISAVILKVDRFGNLGTNVTPQDVPALFQPQPPPFKILIGKREITELHTNYAQGVPGSIFGILGSMGYLEIAANRGSAAQLLGTGKGTEVSLVIESAAAASNGK